MTTLNIVFSIVWYAIAILGVVKGYQFSEFGVALALGVLFDIRARIERGDA